MKRAEETKISLLYEMLQTAVIRGIGNCTQVCNQVADFLKTGVMPIAGWRNRLPALSTNREIDIDISETYESNELGDTGKSDTEKLLCVLDGLLKEGEHVQVGGKMVGRVYEMLGIGHRFNAIKIDGEVKIIDCYQGVSSEPWLKQAWSQPEDFLSHFSNFRISDPEESQLSPVMAEYLERKISLVQAPLVSGARTEFGFFNTNRIPDGPENPEPAEEKGPSFKSGSK